MTRSSSRQPISTADLSRSERRLLAVMRDIWFGRIESIEIRNGQLILEPPPLAIRQVKFGSMQATGLETDSYDYVLTKQAAEFFALIRNIELGKIRSLQITHGVPLLAEFENLPDAFDVEASK